MLVLEKADVYTATRFDMAEVLFCAAGHRLAILLCLMMCFSNRVDADTSQPRIHRGPFAKDLQIGPRMNASNMQLWGSVIVGQDLSHANFDNCNLTNVMFEQCDLSHATFRNAILTGLRIYDCTWGENDFTNSVFNGLLGLESDLPVLSEKQIKETASYRNRFLDDCRFAMATNGEPHVPRFDFGNCSMRNVTFIRANLTESTFENATISAPNFRQCTICFEKLKRAKFLSLDSARFDTTTVTDMLDLSSRGLSAVSIIDPGLNISLSGSRLSGTVVGAWMNAEIMQSTKSYQNRELYRIHFIGASLAGLDLTGQLLNSVGFFQCDLSNVRFDDAVLVGVRFSSPNKGLTADQIRSTWNFKSGRMNLISLPDDLARELNDGAE